MADMLTYVINAATPGNSAVVQRELIVSISGDPATTTTSVWPGSAVDLGTVTAPQDANVTVSLVDVDNAGSRSAPTVIAFAAAGAIPSAAHNGVTVTLVGATTQPDNNA